MRRSLTPWATAGESWRHQFLALNWLARLRALTALAPHLWPKGRIDLKLRVVLALSFLAAAKVATVFVPLFMKHAVDALSLQDKSLIVLPLAAILAYGLARILSLGF